MSDALSDIARDRIRMQSYETFLVSLADYIKDPSDQNYKEVKHWAEKTDSIGRGYWSPKTQLSKDLDISLEQLVNKDEELWTNLLKKLERLDNKEIYDSFKKLSPV